MSQTDLYAESKERASMAARRLVTAIEDLDLNDGERRTVQWLLQWETHTIDNVAAIIEKARSKT